jgi:CheY-like chemotaxis protein
MDVMLPGLDGFAVAEQIRSAENPLHDVPIIACSAHAADEARRRQLAAGMNAFRPKPVDRDELRKVIGRMTDIRQPAPERDLPAPPVPSGKSG